MTAVWKVWFTAILPSHLNLCVEQVALKMPWASLCISKKGLLCCAFCFTRRTFTCGICGIPFSAGIWLCKTVNIRNRLKKIQLGLNQQIVSVSFCEQFWGQQSWKAGGDRRAVCFCCCWSPGSNKANEADRAALLTSAVRKAGNSNIQQGEDIWSLALLSCEGKGSWWSQ